MQIKSLIKLPTKDRLDYELKIITEKGYPGYFLIVMDFVKWAKEQNIPVGPGRGSGAGSSGICLINNNARPIAAWSSIRTIS